jgi:hypothetical protein
MYIFIYILFIYIHTPIFIQTEMAFKPHPPPEMNGLRVSVVIEALISALDLTKSLKKVTNLSGIYVRMLNFIFMYLVYVYVYVYVT